MSTPEEAYREGYKVGFAAGFSDGTNAGYANAKERAFAASEIFIESHIGALSRESRTQLRELVASQLGKRTT